MRIKITLFFTILFFIFFNCNTKKENKEIEIQKIEIQNTLCENCIGLRNIKIKYFFKTNIKLRGTIYLSQNDSLLFRLKQFSVFHVSDSIYNYEYIYDEFNLSKYGNLNQIKRDYKQIIYFKEIQINKSNLKLVTNLKTQILYYLNAMIIDENDDLNMNRDVIHQVSFPKNTQ